MTNEKATANAASNLVIARYRLAQAQREEIVAFSNTKATFKGGSNSLRAAERDVIAAHNALWAARKEWTRLERAERVVGGDHVAKGRAEMLAAPRSMR